MRDNEPNSGEWTGDIMGQLIDCPRCGKANEVVKIHPPVRGSADPTETYTLNCGHRVI